MDRELLPSPFSARLTHLIYLDPEREGPILPALSHLSSATNTNRREPVMRRITLLLPLLMLCGCRADGTGIGDYVVQKAFGDNYGPWFTGESRGEYHDRTQVEEFGYIKQPYHPH
jgi:hypothetical protein